MYRDLCTGWLRIAPHSAASQIDSKRTAGNRMTGVHDIAPTRHNRKGDTKPHRLDIRAVATRVDDGVTRQTSVTWSPWDYFCTGIWQIGRIQVPLRNQSKTGFSGTQTSCQARSVHLDVFSLGTAKSQTSRRTKLTWNVTGTSSLQRTPRNDSHGA